MATTQTERVSEDTYRRLALEDQTNGQLELYQGELREKPEMSVEHGDEMFHLAHVLQSQLDRREYRLRTDHAKLRRSADTYYVPDVAVIPTALERVLRQTPGSLDAYAEPLPMVIEIWSPSTGRYDIDEKLPGYQARGDLQIWRVHPYERMVTVWRKMADGRYVESVHRGGELRPHSLPGVVIDIDVFFAED
jgi:Uma2 family endonuclease